MAKKLLLHWTWTPTDPRTARYTRSSLWSSTIGSWETEVQGVIYYLRLYNGSCYLYKFVPDTDEEQYLADKRLSKSLYKLRQHHFMEQQMEAFPEAARQATEKTVLSWAEKLVLTPMAILSAQL